MAHLPEKQPDRRNTSEEFSYSREEVETLIREALLEHHFVGGALGSNNALDLAFEWDASSSSPVVYATVKSWE